MTDINLQLKNIIKDQVFTKYSDRWLFDFRKVSMTPDFIDLYVNSFFQIEIIKST